MTKFWLGLMVVGMLVLGQLAGLPGGSLEPARVDPAIWNAAAEEPIPFLIVLREQAKPTDLVSPHSQEEAAGQVVRGLQSAAEASQAPLLARLAELGADSQPYWIANFIAVTAPRAVALEMAARPDVAAIISDAPFRAPPTAAGPVVPAAPSRPETVEWNISATGAHALWSFGYTGQGIVFANADTGIDWQHPALQTHYLGWQNGAVDHNYVWWDAIRQDINGVQANPCGYASPEPCDDNGHGTHTLGTGVGDDGAGNQIGMAPGARWIGCRNMDSNFGQVSTYLECLQFFMAPWPLNGNRSLADPERHADVISNSYSCPPVEGCTGNTFPLWQTALANVRAAGIFMAVAAGNDFSATCANMDDPPAIFDEVFTVGAVDLNGRIASFSQRGPVDADGSNRLKPDLSAPGVNVRSAFPASRGGEGYGAISGTSMATPHVAGAVALLWSAYPELRGQVAETEELLRLSANRPSDPGPYCSQGPAGGYPNPVYGWGTLNVMSAFWLQADTVIHQYFPIIWR